LANRLSDLGGAYRSFFEITILVIGLVFSAILVLAARLTKRGAKRAVPYPEEGESRKGGRDVLLEILFSFFRSP
jgi:hypothetical protein